MLWRNSRHFPRVSITGLSAPAQSFRNQKRQRIESLVAVTR